MSMNDGMLSQEEIDALLNGADDRDSLDTNHFLSTFEQDALGEIGNISFGSSATALSQILNQKVEITTPEVSMVYKRDLHKEFPKPYVAVVVDYTEGFSGSNLLIIHEDDAKIIANLMLGGTGDDLPDEFGEIELSAVQEAMNQMMGSAATSMSTIFRKRIEISPPTIDILNIPEGKGTESIPEDDPLVKISFRLKVGNLINSSIMQLIPVQFAQRMVESLVEESQVDHSPKEEAKEASDMDKSGDTGIPGGQPPQTGGKGEENAPGGKRKSAVQSRSTGGSEPKNVQPAVFSDFHEEDKESGQPRNLDMLLDIPLQVTVELGKTKKLIKEILDLSPGSIIELDKLAGEPVDILVNNRLIAQGEVVVIDENFGVRITDILSHSERLKRMK
ncbi:flagellar motor switch phosphatase FliY [Caldibacillus debilis]|uniref:flagellar motor switch phosphatase FliY n=1 Tax=Caldibacillus debilis TaxID=301148 RepID=UPI000E364E98|nr:flagellar motor switch phosphatase FliY [Caldibacillus debilis]REJ29192.1 MAG: flagellar motor switch phosphatase FliY [Caldibacillus debilis]